MANELQVEMGASLKGLKKGLTDAQSDIKGFSGKVGKLTDGVSKSFDGIGSTIAGVVSAGAIIGLGKQILQTTAEFEKFRAVLGNTLGSQAIASLKLKEISDFASKTPFGVAELTGAFIKLANQGFKPTGDEMRKLGDLASSTGKSFDQLAEAIIDAQTGEYERLKEFGVRAKDAGENVIFTFKGVQTTVTKSSEAIRGYITALGDAEGVTGSMAVISQTLTGKISNLGDTWDQMLVSVGANTSGVFSGAIDVMNQAIDKITDYNKKVNAASKFKLDASIADRLQGLVSRKTTTSELKLENILGIEADVSKQVSGFLAAAKSAKDFNNAIRDLQAQAKRDIAGIKDINYAKAIAAQYIEGMKALKDARVKFLEDQGKGPEASFGGTKEKKKTPADILKQLGIELNTIQVTGIAAGDTFAKGFEQSISANKKAIGELLEIGAPSFVGKLAEDIKKLTPVTEGLKVQMAGVADSVTGSMKSINTTNLIPFEQGLKDIAARMPQWISPMVETLNKFNEDVSRVLNDNIGAAFQGIGESIGEAFASGTNVVTSLGATLLSTLGAVLGQLGQMAIAAGVALLAIKASFKTLGGAGAIAAGVALIALAGVVKARSTKLGNSMGSGGGMGSPGGSFDVPTGRSAQVSTSAPSSGEYVFKIYGNDLIAVLNRSGKSLSAYKIG